MMDLNTRRLAAVVAKIPDPSAGATFVFALQSQETFCCPDCPDPKNAAISKRTPMQFFDNAAQALEAGLKSCSTCSPDLSAIAVGEGVIDSTVNVVNASLGIQPSTSSQSKSSPSVTSSTPSNDLLQHPQQQQHMSSHHAENLALDSPNQPFSHTFPTSPEQMLGDNSMAFSDEIAFPSPSPFISGNAYQRFPTDSISFMNHDMNRTSLHSSNEMSLSSDFATTESDSMHHHRSSSITNNYQPTSIEALGWRPRRASIANGHIPAAAAVVDQLIWSTQHGNDGNVGSTVSSPDQSNIGMEQFTMPVYKAAQDTSSTPASVSNSTNAPRNSTKGTSANRGSREPESKHRGEGDHARLVDEACRSIAAAAASAAASAAAAAAAEGTGKESTAQDNAYSLSNGRISISTKGKRAVSISGSSAQTLNELRQPLKLQRKKRRGGILGFKELAAKAGLSPWHFHRVFRSVTGLTPKAYGEACWNAVIADPSLPVAIANGTATPPLRPNPNESATPSPLPEKLEQHSNALSRTDSLSSLSQQQPVFAPNPSSNSPFELSSVPTLGNTPSDTNSSLSFNGGAHTPVLATSSMAGTSTGLWPGVTSATAGSIATSVSDAAMVWNSPTIAGPGMLPMHTTGTELVNQMLATMAPSNVIPGTSRTPFTSGAEASVPDVYSTTAPLSSFEPATVGPVPDDMLTQPVAANSFNGQQGSWSMLAGNPFNMQPVTTPIPHQFNLGGIHSNLGTPSAFEAGHKSAAASPHPGSVDPTDTRQWELNNMVSIS